MQPHQLSPGTIIAGDFKILRPLNEGGMGAVFVVEQMSTGNLRALKVMHAQLVKDPGLRRRFEQEARVGARIKSDHVVQVVGAGVDPATELPFLAMELLEGQDLSAVLEARPYLSAAETWQIFSQLCHALAEAHSVGIVHRDLKPENIFLAEARREGVAFTVKILDFGIAKVVAEAQMSATAAVGTPLWMAPEQTEAGAPIQPATDVWALGLIAFRALTGRLYWRGANSAVLSPTALMREIVLDPIGAASERAREFGCAELVPPGFDPWFARCVARDPSARHRDAGEARTELALVLGAAEGRDGSGSPISLLPPRSGVRTPMVVADTVPVLSPALTPMHSPPSRDEPDEPAPPEPGGSLTPWLLGAVVLVLMAGGLYLHFGRSAPLDAGPRPDASAAARSWKSCPGGMAPLDGGTVAPRGERGERTTLSPFCLDRTEVTVEAFSACVKSGRCSPPGAQVDWPGIAEADRRKWSPFCNGSRADRQTHPVNCVAATQAAAYCVAQGKRLPSEAEWQWAAQGGRSNRLYPWGTAAPEQQACWSGQTDRVADGAGTCPVGTLTAGAGEAQVQDLAGNVWEWTVSKFSDTSDEFVIRGGGFSDDAAEALRSAHRDRRPKLTRSATIGFRCAWPPE